MPPGGRGGSRSSAVTGVRAVANALGITRQDLSNYTQVITEAPPTYPPLTRSFLPLEITPELQYLADVRQGLASRCRESSLFIEGKGKKREFHRYIDKYYNDNAKGEIEPDWSQLPEELCWKREKKCHEPVRKRKKITAKEADEVVKKLSAMEEKDEAAGGEGEVQESQNDFDDIDEDDEEKREKEEEQNELNEQEVPSDDDYQEEDNDYIQSYFDNGENYGEVGSDDNLDDDNAF